MFVVLSPGIIDLKMQCLLLLLSLDCSYNSKYESE